MIMKIKFLVTWKRHSCRRLLGSQVVGAGLVTAAHPWNKDESQQLRYLESTGWRLLGYGRGPILSYTAATGETYRAMAEANTKLHCCHQWSLSGYGRGPILSYTAATGKVYRAMAEGQYQVTLLPLVNRARIIGNKSLGCVHYTWLQWYSSVRKWEFEICMDTAYVYANICTKCDLAHRRCVVVLCMLCKLGVTRCTLFMALCLCRMCRCGLHTALWSHIGTVMRLLAVEPRRTAGLLLPCRYLCGTS